MMSLVAFTSLHRWLLRPVTFGIGPLVDALTIQEVPPPSRVLDQVEIYDEKEREREERKCLINWSRYLSHSLSTTAFTGDRLR